MTYCTAEMYERLADAAEAEDHDPLPYPRAAEEEAKSRGDEIAAQVGLLLAEELVAGKGRPTVAHARAAGTGKSPRRQVILAKETDKALEAYMSKHHMKASEVIRLAVERFLEQEKPAYRLLYRDMRGYHGRSVALSADRRIGSSRSDG